MTKEVEPFRRIEAHALRRQEIAFSVLTMFVTAALLMFHTAFTALLGKPSPIVVALLICCFVAKLVETEWLLRRREGITRRTAQVESAVSMVALFALAGALAVITNRDEAPYFVLLAIPILQCAYHFGLIPTLATVLAAVGMIFGWVIHFFVLHPPARRTEFLECGMISLVYLLMGVLVWSLVDQLRKKESLLYFKMSELQSARESLLREEKLAAVGRFASGIAHEIRNPVAVIASSLTTAAYPDLQVIEREEMFDIAKREAKRLEILTSDFLSYAKPSVPDREPNLIAGILEHVSSAARLRAAAKSIRVDSGPWDQTIVSADAMQIEGALVNLCLNAIDATPEHGRLVVGTRKQAGLLMIDISNSGPAIPEANLSRIFEPFFTTKRTGSGLGLAIARGVAQANGGDLWVSSNADGAVVFTMSLEVSRDGSED